MIPHPPPEIKPRVEVELHNVGGGVAVRVEVRAVVAAGGTVVEPKVLPVLFAGTSFPLALDVDESTELMGVAPEDFRVRGSYRDRLGREQPQILDWQHDELESGV